MLEWQVNQPTILHLRIIQTHTNHRPEHCHQDRAVHAQWAVHPDHVKRQHAIHLHSLVAAQTPLASRASDAVRPHSLLRKCRNAAALSVSWSGNHRVVEEAELAECWRGYVEVPERPIGEDV